MNLKSSHTVIHKKQLVNKKVEYAHKNFKPLLSEL